MITTKYGSHRAVDTFRDGGLYDIADWKELDRRARRLAALLEQTGFKNGARALLLTANSGRWPAAYFAVTFLGGACDGPFAAADDAGKETLSNYDLFFVEGSPSAAGLDAKIIVYLDRVDWEAGTAAARLDGVEKVLPLPAAQGEIPRSAAPAPVDAAAAPRLFVRDRILWAPIRNAMNAAVWLEAAAAAGAGITFLPDAENLAGAAHLLRPTVIAAPAPAIEKLCRPFIGKNFLSRPHHRFVKSLGGCIRYAACGTLPEDAAAFLRKARVSL